MILPVLFIELTQINKMEDGKAKQESSPYMSREGRDKVLSPSIAFTDPCMLSLTNLMRNCNFSLNLS